MPENIIQIDQNLLETRLDRLITEKMTQILNAMLDAEADERQCDLDGRADEEAGLVVCLHHVLAEAHVSNVETALETELNLSLGCACRHKGYGESHHSK